MLTINHIMLATHAVFFPSASNNYESTLGVTLLKLLHKTYRHFTGGKKCTDHTPFMCDDR